MQTILVSILFISAAAYLIRLIYKSFSQKGHCAKGCSCSSVDLKKIEEQISSNQTIAK